MKPFKVIWATKINVQSRERQPNEVFEADEKAQEIRNLLVCRYIAPV